MSEINEREIKRRFRAISQFEPSQEVTARDLEQTRKSLAGKMGKKQPAEIKIWSNIMKSNITKFAAAAIIIIVVVLSIGLWDKSIPAAYAVEQTIEAMRNVTTVHCYITTFTGERMEMWSKINQETGENEYFYIDSPETEITATPDETYMYNKGKNVVIHLKGAGHVKSDVRLGRFIEDMVSMAQSVNGKIQINPRDVDGEKPVILLVIETDKMTIESVIDSETKLPISMVFKPKGEPQPGQIGKSINEMSYNEPLPEGIFDFEIPEGAQIIEQ
jgi:outer membrane lipoprotein-sorting protein